MIEGIVVHDIPPPADSCGVFDRRVTVLSMSDNTGSLVELVEPAGAI
jgi:hypothetical protein